MTRLPVVLLALLLFVPATMYGQTDSLQTASPVDTARTSVPSDPLPVATASSQDTLRVYSRFFSMTGYGYQFGSQKGDVGFGAGKVKAVVKDNPKALAEVNTYAKHQTPAMVLGLASLAGLIYGIADDNGAVFTVSLIGAVAAVGVDLTGYSHLKKAARIFNTDRRPASTGSWITVRLRSGAEIAAVRVAPQGLGTVRVQHLGGEVEYHDASKIQWIRSTSGEDWTSRVLDEGKTLALP